MSDMTPEMRELKEAVEAMSGVVLTVFGRGTDGPMVKVSRLLAAARAVLPKPRRHTFGGVVFEETGEVREAQPGEWFSDFTFARPSLWTDAWPTDGRYTILRPVAVEGAK